MADFKLPYGAEFSPDKIKIKDILRMASANEGDTAENLVTEIAKKYFKKNKSMASNCKNSMVAYDILQAGGGVNELSKDKFPEKVLKYLWDDAFKMDRYSYFNESMWGISYGVS